jgi:hypothetical protein
MNTMISWSFAKSACPSWSSITDESALRNALANLDESGSSLHWWLGFWTFLVALGVILEVVFVVWEYLGERHDFNRGTIHPPERPNTTLFVMGLLGAFLVAAGVSGELWEDSQIAKLEKCIRKGNDAIFLLLSKEAGGAATSAKTARNEADGAVESASVAKRKAEAATKLAGDAESKAKDVGKKADEILRQLAQVDERVRFQGSRAVLLINGEKAFVGALKPFAPQKVIFVTCAQQQSQSQTDEEFKFELTLLNRLTKPRPGSPPGAGWDTYSEGPGSWYACKASGWTQGVSVLYSARSAKAAAEALMSELNKLKISAQATRFNPKDADEFARQKRDPHDISALFENAAREQPGIYVLIGEHP